MLVKRNAVKKGIRNIILFVTNLIKFLKPVSVTINNYFYY